jgi:hypothetical protein
MDSHGMEVLLGGPIIRSKDFSWRTNITMGYNVNKITNAKNIPQIFDLVKPEGGNIVGYPTSSLFSIQFSGLNHINGMPEFINDSGKVSSAVYLQSDSTQYLKFEGSIDPKYTGGFNNTFTYKAFTLNVFITYQGGNKIRLYPAFSNSYSEQIASPKEFYNRWIQPGDEKLTNVPSIIDALQQAFNNNTSFNYPYNNYNFSTERVAKGDFIRLKSISLKYDLPATVTAKSGFLKTASFTVAAINPWLIYSDEKLQGQDPEFYSAGGVAQPIQKQITLSLRLGL